MRTRFSIRRRQLFVEPTEQVVPLASAKARPRRKKALFAGGALACLLTPFLILQVVLYRANLAVARDSFPKAPTLRDSDRLLILAPHCDDETLGAGGTIAEARRRGLPVRLVFLTNGDGSRSTQIAVDARQMRRNSFQQLAKLRQKETFDAANALGVDKEDVIFLGYPDGGTRHLWLRHWKKEDLYRSPYTGATHSPYANARTKNAAYCGEQVLADLKGALRDFRPTVVITTHPNDTHPDHQAAYEFVSAAIEQLRHNNTEAWAKPLRVLTFLVHHGVWPAPYGYNPQAPLVPPAPLEKTGTIWMQEDLDFASRQAKKTALECYPSQLAFTPRYLRSFLRRNELFGALPPQSAKQSIIKPDFAARSIVRDASQDALSSGFLPSADLQSVALLPGKNQNITLRLQARRAPSKRLRYRLWLHQIGAQNSAVSPIEIRSQREKWHATRRRPDGKLQTLNLRPIARGFEIDVPREAKQTSWLLSAESHLRNTRLDATGTGVLRLASL